MNDGYPINIAKYRCGERVLLTIPDLPSGDWKMPLPGFIRKVYLKFPTSPLEEFTYTVWLDESFMSEALWSVPESFIKLEKG